MPVPLGAETCAMCPKMCRFACPTARAGRTDSYHPTGIASAELSARRAELTWEEAAGSMYACTMCLGCNAACALDQDVPAWLRDARAEAVRNGAAPSGVRRIAERLSEESVGAAGEADIVHLASCRAPGSTGDVAAVLGRAGLSVAAVRGCCGALAADVGLADEADALGGRMSAVTRGRRVIADEAPCAQRIGGVPFVVLADELISSGRLTLRRTLGTVGYHDPCRLAREARILDEPRRIAAALSERVVEVRRSGASTYCCGAGGGLPDTHPDLAAAIARERADELAAAGADMVLTASPACASMLRAAGIDVMDIATALAEAV